MFIQQRERAEIKRRLRDTREQKWRMSQAEMADFLRNRLDPEKRRYPSERSYARWESLNSPELPQSWKKISAVATAMDIDLADMLAPVENSAEPPQFLVMRRLDEILETLERQEKALGKLLRAAGEDASPPEHPF